MSRRDRGERPDFAQVNQAPVDGPYRIATVAELTSVPEATLRAWERRYGIPRPERTASGYRLYGAEQVKQVLEMRRLCDEGVSVAEAAKLVSASKPAAPIGSKAEAPAASTYATMVDSILSSIDAFDDAALDEQLRRMLLLGNATQLLDAVITPVQKIVGDRWHEGELSVAQEHFATQKLAAVLRDLIRLSPGAGAQRCAVFASFADDEHEVGLLGFALRVADWGIRPVMLGARTPPSAVRIAVDRLSPVMVALSTTIAPARARARELVEDYSAACGTVPWIVGGAGVAELSDLVVKNGGRVAPADPSELADVVRSLLNTRRTKR